MIGFILFVGICLYEYHVRGIQAALSYLFGMSALVLAMANGLPGWVAFVFCVALCLIIGRLPKRTAESNPK